MKFELFTGKSPKYFFVYAMSEVRARVYSQTGQRHSTDTGTRTRLRPVLVTGDEQDGEMVGAVGMPGTRRESRLSSRYRYLVLLLWWLDIEYRWLGGEAARTGGTSQLVAGGKGELGRSQGSSGGTARGRSQLWLARRA